MLVVLQLLLFFGVAPLASEYCRATLKGMKVIDQSSCLC